MSRIIWISCILSLGLLISSSSASDDGIAMDANPDHSWKQTGYAKSNKTGRSALDLEVKVPVGTLVRGSDE